MVLNPPKDFLFMAEAGDDHVGHLTVFVLPVAVTIIVDEVRLDGAGEIRVASLTIGAVVRVTDLSCAAHGSVLTGGAGHSFRG